MKKGMQAIIETARVELTYCDDWEQTRSVLNGVWRTAFKRGHAKGMKDEQDIARDEMNKTRADFEREV